MAHVGKQPRGSASLVKHRDARDVTGRPLTVPAKIRAAAELLCAQPSTLDLGALAKQVGYRNAKRFARRWPCRSLLGSCATTGASGSSHCAWPIRRRCGRYGTRAKTLWPECKQCGHWRRWARRQTARAGQIAPGMVIVIEQRDGSTMTIGPAQPPVIEHEPYDEASTD
jgi:hypothetical protein